MYDAITRSQLFVLDQDQALDFYINTLGFELAADLDLGFMRWLTVRCPPTRTGGAAGACPDPPAMDDQTAAAIRDLVTKGAMGGWLSITTPDAQFTLETFETAAWTSRTSRHPSPTGSTSGFGISFGNAIRIGQMFDPGESGQ